MNNITHISKNLLLRGVYVRRSLSLEKCRYGTKAAIKYDEKERINQQITLSEKISHMSIKRRLKKPQKPPFVKNLFLGIFDTDVLAYPELEKDDLQTLNKNLAPLNEFFAQPSVQQTETFTEDLIKNLYNLSVFGLRAPQTFGGRELNMTETCRFNEVLSQHSLYPNLVCNEQFVIQALLKMGTEEQKKKYLPDLISGKLLSAFCLSEPISTDPKLLNTKATRSDKTWIINGEKACIINGNIADLFIVLAVTHSARRDDMTDNYITAFLVERSFGGVSSKMSKNLSLGDVDIASVTFDNTPVPQENVIGELNFGIKVVANILNELRLSSSPACITLTKKLLNTFIESCKNAANGTQLIDTNAVKIKVGTIASSIYAMESVTYLTTGLMDQYEDQDCEVEAAICKVLCSELCHLSTVQCLDFIGPPAYLTDHWCNKFHREAVGNLLFHEGNDGLKIMIALLGIQFVGQHIQEKVRKFRNPFFYPWDNLKRLWYQRKQMEDNPLLNLNLNYYLHPTVAPCAKLLEYCIMRLEFAVESLLVRYGVGVINEHNDLKLLAESVVDIYAMTACLARASRAYCIGLQNAGEEVLLANAFCAEATERAKQKINTVLKAHFESAADNYTLISDTAFQRGQYFSCHPLSRNF